MLKALGASLSAAICAVTAADAAVFVENFDDQNIGRSWGVYDSHGQFVTTAGGGIEIQRGVVTASHTGSQHVELDSHGRSSNSSMAAVVDLVAGLTYKMTFAYKPRTGRDGDNGIGFSIGSLMGNSFSMTQWVDSVDGNSNTQRDWNLIDMVFTASEGDNAIQFSALGRANTYGGLLDSIKIEQVTTPVPAAGLLLVTGLVALRSSRQRKRLTLG
ncbi:MAG: hypothetical protein AAFR65_09075 [Pseudomonadota bacterium]